MTKSALQIARAAYQPKLPKALKGAVKVKEGEPTQSVADQEAIKALFPNTYGMPLIQFVEGEAVNMPAINVGVILSGGQAPGGHNVISGLFDGRFCSSSSICCCSASSCHSKSDADSCNCIRLFSSSSLLAVSFANFASA